MIKKFPFIRLIVFLEIIIFFGILNLSNYALWPEQMGFSEFILHPYWLVILLMAVRYGFGAGFLSGLLAAGHYFFFLFGGLPMESDFEHLVDNQGLLLPVAFLASGVIIGAIRQKQIEVEREKDRRLDQKEKSIDELRQSLTHSEKARQVLENHIVGEISTIKRLYEMSRQLEGWDVEQIYQGCLEIISQHFNVQQAYLYIKEDDFFYVKAATGSEKDTNIGKRLTEKNHWLNLVCEKNKPMTIRDFMEKPLDEFLELSLKPPLAAFPLRNAVGNPIGVVSVEKIDFFYLNRSHLNAIGLLVDWVGQSLERVKLFNGLREQSVYDEDHDMYTYSYFQDMLKNEHLRARTFDLDLTVSLIKLDNFHFLPKESQKLLAKALSALLKRFMSKTDMIFRYRIDGVFAVISPMMKKEDIAPAFEQVIAGFKEICCGPLLTTVYNPEITVRMTELHDIQDPIELMGLSPKVNQG